VVNPIATAHRMPKRVSIPNVTGHTLAIHPAKDFTACHASCQNTHLDALPE
jgi:hypothetical protein